MEHIDVDHDVDFDPGYDVDHDPDNDNGEDDDDNAHDDIHIDGDNTADDDGPRTASLHRFNHEPGSRRKSHRPGDLDRADLRGHDP